MPCSPEEINDIQLKIDKTFKTDVEFKKMYLYSDDDDILLMTTPQFKTFIPSEAPSWWRRKSYNKQFKDDMINRSLPDLKQWKPYLQYVSKDVLEAYKNKPTPKWFRQQIDAELARKKGGYPFMKYLSQFSPSILKEIYEKIGFVALAKIFLKIGPGQLVKFTSYYMGLSLFVKKIVISRLKDQVSKTNSDISVTAPSGSAPSGFAPTEAGWHDTALALGALYLVSFGDLTTFERATLLILVNILNHVANPPVN